MDIALLSVIDARHTFQSGKVCRMHINKFIRCTIHDCVGDMSRGHTPHVVNSAHRTPAHTVFYLLFIILPFIHSMQLHLLRSD